MPEGAVFVGRPSRWGNQYRVGVAGDAAECVRKYAESLTPYRHKGPNSTLESCLLSVANLEAVHLELRGKDLACWCPLDEPCHADVLLEMANK